MRACEAVNTDKAWLWLSVILLRCISHRSTFTVWLIVLLWNWKLQIRTNSSESCMTVCDAHPCLFDWFLNQWSDSAALKRLHCTVMVCECAHIQTEKDSAWKTWTSPAAVLVGFYSHTILVKFGFLFLTEMIWKSQTYKDFSFAHFILWS